MSIDIHILGDSCLCLGSGAQLQPHAPHAFTVCVALRGRLRVRLAGGAWHSCASAVIAPDLPRELDAADASACALMVGPETPDGRRFAWKTTLDEPLPPLPPAAEPEALSRLMIDAFAAASRPRAVDPRVLTVLRMIRASPGIHLPLAQMADAVALSPSRLQHLFHEQTHISIKRYSLWLRLLAAFRAMASGASLTGIAYSVGFADPAHLSRSFRQFLGMNPSDVMRNSISVQDDDRSVQTHHALPALPCAQRRIEP